LKIKENTQNKHNLKFRSFICFQLF